MAADIFFISAKCTCGHADYMCKHLSSNSAYNKITECFAWNRMPIKVTDVAQTIMKKWIKNTLMYFFVTNLR